MHILYSKGKEGEPKSKNPRLFVMTDAAVESKMQRIVEASNGSSDLVRLVEISRSRGMMGIHGTWEQFLEVYDPTYGKVFTSTSWRPRLDLVTFLYSLTEMEDLRILALCLRPTRCLVYDFSRDVNNESVEQFLVRKTLSHADHHFDHLFPFNSGKRVLTESKWFFADAKLRVPLTRRMIAVRCAVVICEDESVAAARVVAVDDNFNVLLDTFVKPDKPVVHYRTAITGITAQDVENVEALSLADVQAQLVKLFTHDVIMVGYQLHLDLHALKMDHARLIDTSTLIKHQNRIPSLNTLLKSLLDFEVPNSPGRCAVEALSLIGLVRYFVNFYTDIDDWVQRRKRKRAFVVGKPKLKLQLERKR